MYLNSGVNGRLGAGVGLIVTWDVFEYLDTTQ